MPGKILEMKPIVPTEAQGEPKQISKADALRAFRESKPGAQKQEVVTDILGQKIKDVEEMISNKDEFEILPKSNEDANDPLVQLTGGTDVVLSSTARRKLEDLIAVLSEDLSNSPTKSKALIFKEEASNVVQQLFTILNLSSESSEDQLRPVQDSARRLLEEAVNNGTKSGIEPGDVFSILGMLNSDKSKSIKSTVDLINSVGLDKLIKKDSGFISKLKRSYGKLGGALASFVQNKVLALTTRPLDTLSETNVDEDVAKAVKDFKEDLFYNVESKIQSELEKRSSSLNFIRTEDSQYIPEFMANLKNLFLANEDTAESAGREFTKLILTKTARISKAQKEEEQAKAKAKELTAAISKASSDNPRVVVIPKDLIAGNEAINEQWYKDLVESSRLIINKPPADHQPTSKEFFEYIQKIFPDDLAVDISKFIPDTFDIEPKSLNADQIKKIKGAISADSNNVAQINLTGNSVLKNASGNTIHPKNLVAAFKKKLAQDNEQSFLDKVKRAKEIFTIANDSGKQDIEKIANVLSKESEYFMYVDSGKKGIAEGLKSSLDKLAKERKADAKYFQKFIEEINSKVIAPIMSKSSAISKTVLHALSHSMLDSEGNIHEEFKDAFGDLHAEAKAKISAKKDQEQQVVDALKVSLQERLSKKLNSLTVGYTQITGIINESELISLLYDKNGNETDVSKKLGIRLSSAEKEILDTSNDRTKTPYDLDKAKLERIRIISEKLLTIKNAKLDNLPAQDVNKLNSYKNNSSNITKDYLTTVKNLLSSLKADFDKVTTAEKDLDKYVELAGEDDVWELATGTHEHKGLISKILDDLKDKVQYGIRAVLRSAGLHQEDNMKILASRLEKADADSELQGIPAILRTTFGNLISTTTRKPEASATKEDSVLTQQAA
jgi:hypothetical protein